MQKTIVLKSGVKITIPHNARPTAFEFKTNGTLGNYNITSLNTNSEIDFIEQGSDGGGLTFGSESHGGFRLGSGSYTFGGSAPSPSFSFGGSAPSPSYTFGGSAPSGSNPFGSGNILGDAGMIRGGASNCNTSHDYNNALAQDRTAESFKSLFEIPKEE